jgi:hypothetical protein
MTEDTDPPSGPDLSDATLKGAASTDCTDISVIRIWGIRIQLFTVFAFSVFMVGN